MKDQAAEGAQPETSLVPRQVTHVWRNFWASWEKHWQASWELPEYQEEILLERRVVRAAMTVVWKASWVSFWVYRLQAPQAELQSAQGSQEEPLQQMQARWAELLM